MCWELLKPVFCHDVWRIVVRYPRRNSHQTNTHTNIKRSLPRQKSAISRLSVLWLVLQPEKIDLNLIGSDPLGSCRRHVEDRSLRDLRRNDWDCMNADEKMVREKSARPIVFQIQITQKGNSLTKYKTNKISNTCISITSHNAAFSTTNCIYRSAHTRFTVDRLVCQNVVYLLLSYLRPTGLQPDCLHGLRTSLRYVLVHPLSFF